MWPDPKSLMENLIFCAVFVFGPFIYTVNASVLISHEMFAFSPRLYFPFALFITDFSVEH